MKMAEVALGDCVEMNDATYTPKEEWPFVNYLDTGNITENRISEIQHLVAGKDEYPSRARRKVQPGDILYSTVRPNQRHFGLLKAVPEHFLASTGFAVIRGKRNRVRTDFLYWFLAQDSVVEHLQTIAEHSTSAYPSIRPVDIERLTLKLPPLAEQHAIAHVLGTLDEKFELNQRMAETLEETVGTLFKSWFVNTTPLRSLTSGDKSEKSQQMTVLSDLFDLNPPRQLVQGRIAPYLDMANMPTRTHNPRSVSSRRFSSGTRFQNGDTLVARITPCLERGKLAYVDFLKKGEVGCGSTEFIVMRPKHPIPNEFAYFLARESTFRRFAIKNMIGSSGRQRASAQRRYQVLSLLFQNWDHCNNSATMRHR